MTRLLPSSRRIATALTSAVGALAVFGVVSTASAHSEFPGLIQDHFPDLGCAPQCTLCHVSPLGGDPEKSNGATAYVGPHRGYGLFLTNLLAQQKPNTLTDDNLIMKLDGLAKLPCNTGDASDTGICDSDGDRVPDYEEVSKGDDPDETGAGNGAICPKYGCGASSIATLPRRSQDSGRAGAVMAALGVTLIFARRFRR